MTECVIYQGTLRTNGYGPHRKIFAKAFGPIPKGIDVDHICRTRACINLDHLRLLPHRENVLLGDGPTARNARKTHCKRGHLLSEENILRYKRHRFCKRCQYMHQARYRKERRNAAQTE